MSTGKGNPEKTRYWEKTISEAARSGTSIRQFCRQHRLKESQFYWWQHKLRTARPAGATPRPSSQGGPATFALVSEAGTTDAGIELVLGDGRKLRIWQGVDEETLRTVLAALDQPRC